MNEFDDLTEPGYYTYSLQDGTGEINGILVISSHGYSVTSQKAMNLTAFINELSRMKVGKDGETNLSLS